jgi:serine/threonine protein kinase
MNCIIANKYEIIEEVGQGTFGKVFRGKHIRTNEDVAIKIQFKSILNVLQHEAKLYKHLENSIGIPTMRNYGHEEGFHYLILDYLDKPLDKLEMTPSECISYFIEAVNVLETIHTLGILHRDIKPDNLMIKERSRNANQLYVIDFGLSKWFLDSSGNHIKEKTTKTMVGTIKYSSINVHNGIEPSRRDDLESLCYTFMSLYGKELMWVNVCEELKRIDETDETQEPKKKLVCEKIKTLKLEDTLFFELPEEFRTIVFYVRNLSFEEKPNYNYIINVVFNLLNNVVNTGSDTLEMIIKRSNKEDYNGV